MNNGVRWRVDALLLAGVIAAATTGTGATMACGPLTWGSPRDSPRAAASAPPPEQEVVTIRTGDDRSFYLVDIRRSLCFFGYRRYPQLTRVPCEDIPEARELLGFGDAPVAPAPSSESTGEPPVASPSELRPVIDGEPPTEPEPDLPPAAPPTEEERERFTAAYVEVFCAYRRAGTEDTGPPDEASIAEGHGLSPERYQEVRKAFAGDAEAWGELSRKALAACP